MRSIISLKFPIALEDEQGNKYTVSQISGDISISGGTVHFQPTLHQCRDSINRKANATSKPSNGLMSHTEVFVLSPADVQGDEEMAILLEQVKQRATDLIKAKLDAVTI